MVPTRYGSDYHCGRRHCTGYRHGKATGTRRISKARSRWQLHAASSFDPLLCVSPLDGRYSRMVAPLQKITSEYGLIMARVQVEVEWMKCLAEEPKIKEVPLLSDEMMQLLDSLTRDEEQDSEQITNEEGTPTLRLARRVKEVERVTNHDVKAVEYVLKEEITRAIETFSGVDKNCDRGNDGANGSSQKLADTCVSSRVTEELKLIEFVHFACTSEDINNLAHGIMLKRARDEVSLHI